jgi:RNA polymerase sigma-70 factor, ECF subfamily
MTDEERFTLIFEIHYGRVSAYVRRRVPRSAAADIVADTFLAAWRRLEQLDDHPLPWLYRAASLEISHQRRTLQRDQRLWEQAAAAPWQVLEEGDDPADLVVSRAEWKAGFAALAEADREVLRLVAWEDLEPSDAARALGCSVTAFRVRLHRARRRLSVLTTESPFSERIKPAPLLSERPSCEVDGHDN